MKTVTSATVWNDAVGKRMSITYSEIDETTGTITADNKRIDRIITDADQGTAMTAILNVAQAFVDKLES